MNCAICSQRTSQERETNFYGDSICQNCARRLKVGKLEPESIEDTFLPSLVPDGDVRRGMVSLSNRAAHLGRRGGRGASAEVMVALVDRLNRGTADRGSVTGMLLMARTLALYGDDSNRFLKDAETRYLLGISMEQAGILQAHWKDDLQTRSTVLRAFLGNIMRGFAANAPLCERAWNYILQGN